MRRSLTIMATATFLGLTTGCVEMQRTCSSQEMIAMKEKGFTVDDIDNMCTAYKVKEESIKAVADVMKVMATNPKDRSKQDGSGEQQSSVQGGEALSSAAYCTTQYGSCPLGTRVPAGLECQCRTPYGSIPGVTQ
ncbi:MAG: hypothetical protein AAB308_00145 [Nitrospirota bacterium]